MKIQKQLLKEMLRFGLPTIPATLSIMIMQVANIPILKEMTNSQTVAIYAVNNRLSIPMMLFISVFIYAWKPFYMGRYEDSDAKNLFARVLTYFSFSAAIIFLTVGFFIKFIVTLPFIGGTFIDSSYWSGLGIVPIVMTSYYLSGVFNNLAAGFYIVKKTDYLPLAIGTAAILNIVLNIVLIPYLGIWGSALATLISYFLAVVIIYIFLQKVYPIKYEWKRLVILIVLTGSFYLTGTYFTNDMTIAGSFIVRLLFIAGYLVSLFVTKFFNKAEIISFLAIFKRKKIV